MQIRKSELVKRDLPINYNQLDKNLFEKEFEKFFEEVNSEIFQNIYILSNGICFKNGILFDLFLNKFNIGFENRIKLIIKTLLVLVSSFNTVKINNGILITDHFSAGIFHWFGDVLQKLEALDGIKFDLSEYVFLIPKDFASTSSLDSLKVYDVNYKVVEKNHKILANRLLVIPELAPSGNYRPELMQNMRNRFKDFYNITPKQKRIFITRSKALKRKIINEDKLFQILKKFNFDILVFEDMSFDEQYKCIAESNLLVSLHGAGLTHMLWLKKNSKVLEIRAKKDLHNNCFYSLSSALKLKYYYLLADKTNVKSTQLTDFIVDPLQFEELITQMIEEINK